ncbi:MAG: YsnF/AvaK domain-containing protein [Gemmataceae bacterium]
MAEKRKTRKTDNTASQAVGAGVGLTGGAAAGAALGSLAGPVGTAVGALVGGVAGGLAGAEVADAIDPAVEEKYWETEYTSRPYVKPGMTYAEYRPAYRYGVEAENRYHGEKFEDVERRLSRNWPKSRGESSLTWSKAKGAVRDAYDRALRLHEERLRVDKEQVQTGEVAVHKEVKTERQTIDVPVEREEVVVTRRPATGRGGPIGEREEIRVPVKEERVKVSKETVPVEEVTIGRRKVRGTHRVDETVRREEAHVEEKGNVTVHDSGRTKK